MATRLPFCLELGDFEETRHWRQARIDAINALSEVVVLECTNLAIDFHQLVLSLHSHAEHIATCAGWLPKRPGRRMPPAEQIARYWAGERPGVFRVNSKRPACFCCGSEWDRWGQMERAHLVDRWCGGLDHAGNLVMLCARCHALMPPFSINEADEAIDWINAGIDVHLRAILAKAKMREAGPAAQLDWIGGHHAT